MQGNEFPGINGVKRKQVALALEFTCELCREYRSLAFLELHAVEWRYGTAHDPQRGLLLVCNLCHCHIHELPVSLERQHRRIWKRSPLVRQELRRILGHSPRKYSPPDDFDYAALYQSLFDLGSLVLNGT
jgi:hypothetical protein